MFDIKVRGCCNITVSLLAIEWKLLLAIQPNASVVIRTKAKKLRLFMAQTTQDNYVIGSQRSVRISLHSLYFGSVHNHCPINWDETLMLDHGPRATDEGGPAHLENHFSQDGKLEVTFAEQQ